LTKAVVEAGADRGYASISAVPSSSLAVPATLHASLLGRLDRLGPSAKTVAQVGAAIGCDFSYELLAAAAPLAEPELQEALDRLVEAGLVFQRGVPPAAEYLFKHALVQDTAYSTLLRGPRQALHRRIAEALEPRFPESVETRREILAHHYGEAAIADKAITYWHLAGKLSVARSAVREAIAQLRRGLGLLEGLPETRERKQLELDIQVTLTTALRAGKGLADPEVVVAAERANRLVIETASVGSPLHFSVLYGLWVSSMAGGSIAAGLEHATNFLSIAQSQPSSGPLLDGHCIVANSLISSGDYRAALAHLETAASTMHWQQRPPPARGAGTQKFIDCAVSSPPGCHIPIRPRPRIRSAPHWRSPASKAHAATNCAPRRTSPGSGASRAGEARHASCSRPSTAGSPRASTPPISGMPGNCSPSWLKLRCLTRPHSSPNLTIYGQVRTE